MCRKLCEIGAEPGSAQGREGEKVTERSPDSGPGIAKIPAPGGGRVRVGPYMIVHHSVTPPPGPRIRFAKVVFITKIVIGLSRIP